MTTNDAVGIYFALDDAEIGKRFRIPVRKVVPQSPCICHLNSLILQKPMRLSSGAVAANENITTTDKHTLCKWLAPIEQPAL